jgi:hypothetical protein
MVPMRARDTSVAAGRGALARPTMESTVKICEPVAANRTGSAARLMLGRLAPSSLRAPVHRSEPRPRWIRDSLSPALRAGSAGCLAKALPCRAVARLAAAGGTAKLAHLPSQDAGKPRCTTSVDGRITNGSARPQITAGCSQTRELVTYRRVSFLRSRPSSLLWF